MRQFEDSGGRSRFGFTMKAVDLIWLKKMLLKGFVGKIELEISEIARTSDVLNDAVRLIFFAMFRHRMTLSVLDHIYNSSMIRTWNRANPKHSIGPGVTLPKETIRTILKPIEATVLQIQTQIREFLENRIPLIKDKWDDQEKLLFFIDEIVKDLDPLIFFILAGSKEEDRMVMIKDIGAKIITFANMVDALDMASLLSIELASTAEKSALMRVMTQQNFSDMIKDISKLKPLVKESKFRGTTIVISIPRYISKNGERLKFRLSFYNDAADADTERRLMEDFTERNGRFGPEKKLDDYFYKEGSYGDNAMRFYYLTMLRQLCEEHNIMMNLGIRAAHSSNQDFFESSVASVTTLSFGL